MSSRYVAPVASLLQESHKEFPLEKVCYSKKIFHSLILCSSSSLQARSVANYQFSRSARVISVSVAVCLSSLRGSMCRFGGAKEVWAFVRNYASQATPVGAAASQPASPSVRSAAQPTDWQRVPVALRYRLGSFHSRVPRELVLLLYEWIKGRQTGRQVCRQERTPPTKEPKKRQPCQ